MWDAIGVVFTSGNLFHHRTLCLHSQPLSYMCQDQCYANAQSLEVNLRSHIQAKFHYLPLDPLDNGKQCKSKMMSVSLNPSASGLIVGKTIIIIVIFFLMIAVASNQSQISQGTWSACYI